MMEVSKNPRRNEDYEVSCRVTLNQLANEEDERLKFLLLDDLLTKADKLRRVEDRRFWAMEAIACFVPQSVKNRVSQRKARTGTAQKRQADIAVVTIKREELYATKMAFGIDTNREEDYEANGLRFWETAIPAGDSQQKERVIVTMVGEPGNYSCAVGCSRLFDSYDVGLCILVGIAAGLKDKVKLGDVVAAELVLDYERARLESGGKKKRPVPFPLQVAIRRDLAYYDPVRCGWRDNFSECLQNLLRDPNSHVPEEVKQSWVSEFHGGVILAGAKLLADGKLPEMRVEFHERVRAGEMEGAGFARICDEYKKPWLIFRGISDYGEPDKHTQKDWQEVSALAAATAASTFLRKVYRKREMAF